MKKFILDSWIVEFNIANKSISKNWIHIIKTESSVKSTVNIKRNIIIWGNNYIETSCVSNKLLYQILVDNKAKI